MTRTIRVDPTMSWTIWKKLSSKRISVMNMNASRILPASCIKFLGLLSPILGTPANKDRASPRDSARTSRRAPIRAKFLSRNWISHKIEYAMVWKCEMNRHQPVAQSEVGQLTCRTTMKNKSPHAICTRMRPMTITTPPTWPSKFTRTKTVAKNFPQFHEAFMYSFCSFHLKRRQGENQFW